MDQMTTTLGRYILTVLRLCAAAVINGVIWSKFCYRANMDMTRKLEMIWESAHDLAPLMATTRRRALVSDYSKQGPGPRRPPPTIHAAGKSSQRTQASEQAVVEELNQTWIIAGIKTSLPSFLPAQQQLQLRYGGGGGGKHCS
jgi:hypothetical protein